MIGPDGPSPPWSDDERVAVAVLAGLPGMTVARLRSALRAGRPDRVLDSLAAGRPPDGPIAHALRRDPSLGRRWSSGAGAALEPMGAALASCGVRVVGPADAEWPDRLSVDPDPPGALFLTGGAIRVDRRHVAIVGTRRPTASGRRFAGRLGHRLADADVCVVSGLALGIDGAAHEGALRAEGGAGPVAVVANGHDRPYPRRHELLWHEVERAGTVVSEWPPGTPPDAFRFPLRNRIIAALSDVVVVIESRETGGSLITARAAADRGVDVLAVPGSPGSRASAGTNLLLRDGAGLVLGPDDVFDALGLDHSRLGPDPVDPRPRPSRDEAAILDVVRDEPLTVDGIVSRTGRRLGEVAMHLARLERAGWVFETDGWFEALGPWSSLLDRPTSIHGLDEDAS